METAPADPENDITRILKDHFDAHEASYLNYDKDTHSYDMDLNSLKSVWMRESIRFTPEIRAVLRNIWEWTDLDKDGNIDQEEYARMFEALYPFLYEVEATEIYEKDATSRQEIHKMARAEYEKDALFDKVANRWVLGPHRFYISFFHLSDRWTAIIDPPKYIIFLKRIHAILKAHPSPMQRLWTLLKRYDGYDKDTNSYDMDVNL
jgi:hypothetical protein